MSGACSSTARISSSTDAAQATTSAFISPSMSSSIARLRNSSSATTTRRPFGAKANVHRIVAAKALERQLMVRPLPFIEVIPFSPPLCITQAECDEAVERFARALDDATPELQRLAKQAA